jgi:large subunit ribosomal protein L25
VSEVRIAAEPRTEFGKGAARRVRRSHKVPAVVYGHGERPQHVALPGHELMLALKQGSNVLIHLDLDGQPQLVLPRAVQRDPIKGFLEHVDLLLVRRGERVTVEVPIRLTGEAPTETLVDQQATTLSVEAEATNIPDGLEVSIDGLAVGDAVTAAQVRLPAGVTLVGAADGVIVHGMPAPTAEQFEAELAGAEAELGAGTAGVAAQAAAAAPGEPRGEGDVVPDTSSGEGGPGQEPRPAGVGTSAGPTSGG